MVRFHYRKLYVDLVTPEGLVCIAYVSELAVAGLVQRGGGYELYAPSGERRVMHATAPARVRASHDLLSIRFPTELGGFELHCQHGKGHASSPEHAPTAGLHWKVVVHLGDAQVNIERLGHEPTVLLGTSYADEVVLQKPPRALGLRRIRWGRAHIGRSSLVFNRIALDSGQTWQTVSDGASWSSELELLDDPHGLSTVRHAGTDFELTSGRALHEGAAIDRERFPTRRSRYLARTLSGPVAEARRLSRVEDALGRAGVFLHEDVRLG